jgi:hypothetical protein
VTDFEVAHLNVQGQQVIIVVVNSSVGFKSDLEQNQIRNSLQLYASNAGLAGTVALVWDVGGGRLAFLAPRPWYSFFQSLTLADVARNINKKLTCG